MSGYGLAETFALDIKELGLSEAGERILQKSVPGKGTSLTCPLPKWDTSSEKREDFMPKQNRVTPYGELIAATAHGTLMGNRGLLHNDQQQIVRPYKSKAWIICLLEFKGRRRNVMSPGKYTELFFLDEATALAAGHRPCYECQRERAQAFRAAWIAANPDAVEGSSLKMGQIDEVLHKERLTTTQRTKDQQKQTYLAPMDDLPNGTFIEWQNQPCLVWDSFLYLWTAEGYLPPIPRPAQEKTVVLTPRSTVKTLTYGYTPIVHQSAGIGKQGIQTS